MRKKKISIVFEDICVACGSPIAEGRMICTNCEAKINSDSKSKKGKICITSLFSKAKKQKRGSPHEEGTKHH